MLPTASVLILDCPACVDPARANVDGRQADGLREWTAEFETLGARLHPVGGEDTLRCPECRSPGRIYSY